MRYPSDIVRSRITLAALALVLAAFTACGVRGTGADTQRVPMVVENQNFYQATIFAILNGGRVRVGNVHGGSTATMQAPSPPTGQMRVEVRLLAVGAFTSYPVTVQPGDTIRVTVPPDLHLRAR